MLIEVQGLVDASPLANPRRVAVGFESNRVALLLAVLHRHAGVALHAQDVFVNVVGGVRLAETAADLAVVAALLSSLSGRPLRAGPRRVRRARASPARSVRCRTARNGCARRPSTASAAPSCRGRTRRASRWRALQSQPAARSIAEAHRRARLSSVLLRPDAKARGAHRVAGDLQHLDRRRADAQHARPAPGSTPAARR